jgi:hypothetical protein
LALAASPAPEAARALERAPELKRAIAAGALTWDTVAREEATA